MPIPSSKGADRTKPVDKLTVEVEVRRTRQVKERFVKGAMGCKTEVDKDRKRGMGMPGKVGVTNHLELTW